MTDLLNGANSESYGYSPREFLASADGPWDELDFTYDQVGNRLSRTLTTLGTPTTDSYSYGTTDNRLASISGGTTRTFTYDAAGKVTFDNSTGAAYNYTYNAANRMESFAIGGVVQAEYDYDPQGRQIIRRLTQDQKTIHNIFDLEGNRIAEYEIDDLTSTSTLVREYVWMDGVPVAVVENDEVYFIRSVHIGRPVFAIDATGTVVWTASYLPFGGVLTKTGTPMKLRFPGQWFQSLGGLHQNWMRDFTPLLKMPGVGNFVVGARATASFGFDARLVVGVVRRVTLDPRGACPLLPAGRTGP